MIPSPEKKQPPKIVVVKKGTIIKKNRFFFAISLLTICLMLIAPLIASGIYANIIWLTAFNGVIIYTIWMMGKDRRALFIGLALAVPYVGFNILSPIFSSLYFMAFSKIFLCIYVLYAIVYIARKVLKEPIVDTNLIFGSIMVYLLAGIFWSRLYWLGDMLHPESTFKGLIDLNLRSHNIADAVENQFNLFYYSFTTLATLGIGDIVPLRHVGKVLTITEAVFGQLFIATAISKLVSVWRHQNEPSSAVPVNQIVRGFKAPIPSSEIRHKGSFVGIFVLVLTIVMIAPLFLEGYYANLFLQACFNLLILFTVYTLGDHTLELSIGMAIAIPFLAFDWISIYTGSLLYMTISLIFLCLFLVYAIAFIANKVIREPIIDTNLIFGVIMIYLLAGILWSKLYWLTEALAPNSFTGVAKIDIYGGDFLAALQNQFDFFYYSFTTSASLGLGDIAPLSHVAKTLTALEAIFGQLFVATTVAKMVSAWRMRT